MPHALLEQFVEPRTPGQRVKTEFVRMPGDDVDGAVADRTRRPQHGDGPHAGVGRAAGIEEPMVVKFPLHFAAS